MATAFAERERDRRGRDDVEIVTGGTDPADHVHEEVVAAMADASVDVSGRTPREVTFVDIRDADYVITMGCSAEAVCPAGWAGENRDWDLDDPDGRPPEQVATIRDEIEARVRDIFDELAGSD